MYSKWFENTFWTQMYFLDPKLKILKRFWTHKHILDAKHVGPKITKFRWKLKLYKFSIEVTSSTHRENVHFHYWNDLFDTKWKCTISLLKWLVRNVLIIVVISTLFYNLKYCIVPKISCPYNWSWINEFDHDLSANKSLKLIPPTQFHKQSPHPH